MRGSLDAAIECYRQALRLRPGHILAHFNMGMALQKLDRIDEAIACYQQTLALRPDYLNARANLGVALARAGRRDDAIACYQQVLRVKPDMAEVHANLGKALGDNRDWDAAIASYRQALRLAPNSADTHYCLGIALTEQGKFEEALACYEQVLRFEPNHAEAHLNRAFIWLLLGQWTAGWREFEWRLQAKGGPQYHYWQPRWDGSPLGGRTLFVVAEQGFGDTLHFFRYVRLLEKLGIHGIFQCQSELERLFGNSLGTFTLVRQGTPLPAFDAYVPLPGLPGILCTTPQNVPADVPYLNVDDELAGQWRRQLQPVKGMKVGIVWQGNPTRGSDRERSIPLACFASLAQMEGVHLISLQKGPAAEQLQSLPTEFSVHDLGSQLHDFMDTAALVKNLDLVVCCDTSIAHLAVRWEFPFGSPWLCGRIGAGS